MRTVITLILCLLMWYSTKGYAQQTIKKEKKVILIDAGHGGRDSGTVSKNGIQEKDIVLDIAKSMIAWNKGLLESKYDIYMTRNKDTLISLGDRTKLAKYLRPDIFISLHCNHIDNPNVRGVELYIYDTNYPYYMPQQFQTDSTINLVLRSEKSSKPIFKF